jgi:hypothetical protein
MPWVRFPVRCLVLLALTTFLFFRPIQHPHLAPKKCLSVMSQRRNSVHSIFRVLYLDVLASKTPVCDVVLGMKEQRFFCRWWQHVTPCDNGLRRLEWHVVVTPVFHRRADLLTDAGRPDVQQTTQRYALQMLMHIPNIRYTITARILSSSSGSVTYTVTREKWGPLKRSPVGRAMPRSSICSVSVGFNAPTDLVP